MKSSNFMICNKLKIFDTENLTFRVRAHKLLCSTLKTGKSFEYHILTKQTHLLIFIMISDETQSDGHLLVCETGWHTGQIVLMTNCSMHTALCSTSPAINYLMYGCIKVH